LQSRDAGADFHHFTGKFMAGNQRFTDNEIADAPVGEIMEVASTDSAGSDTHPYLVLAERRYRSFFKA
jgi:hypothetical protein